MINQELMYPNNIPATTITPSQDSPQSQTFVVPEAPNPQTVNYRTPETSKIKKTLIIGGVVLFVGVGIGVLFFIAPKMMTARFAITIKPKINSLQNSVALVKSSMNLIHYDITSDSNTTQNDSLRSSGVIISPKIADLLVGSNVLGASTKNLGLLEQSVFEIRDQVKGKLSSLVEKNNVAAASSSTDNPYNARFRLVKDETAKANTNISKAQNDLKTLSDNIQARPLLLSSQAQTQIVSDITLDSEIKPYLDQAQKISLYYQNLSSMVIDMNDKISSFKTALASATTTFSQLNNKNLTNTQIKTILDESQVYLDQAKKDTTDIKTSTQNFKNISSDSLPNSSDKYQAHNVKVLDLVGNYFDSESTIMQGFIDETNALNLKAQSGTLTSLDTTNYLNKISSGGQQATLADTKFVSDLNSLTGEESSLTISFWQDNGILTKGDQVEADINHLQQNINSL